MDKKQELKLSKFLSLILRHKPEEVGLELDENGWADVDKLIEKARQNGKRMTKETLFEIVKNSDKQRFGLNENKTKIRANQGHSIAVDLELEEKIPPSVLYHGTAEKNLESIFREGLKKMNRNHVHLSDCIETAKKVGERYGKPVVLEVDANRMYKEGNKFYISENEVWLVESVSESYLKKKIGT